MEDYSKVFRHKLPDQTEICARKSLEILEKNLRGEQSFTPEEIYYLASAAEILLDMSEKYGKK
jgi:hypothetical protein